MLKKIGFLALFVVMIFFDLAYADLDLSAVNFGLNPIETVAVLYITAAAGIWIILKVLSLIKRG